MTSMMFMMMMLRTIYIAPYKVTSFARLLYIIKLEYDDKNRNCVQFSLEKKCPW